MATSFFGGAFFGGDFYFEPHLVVSDVFAGHRRYHRDRSLFDKKHEWEERLDREFRLNHPKEKAEVPRIIVEVAVRQLESPTFDKQKRFDELAREFALRKLRLRSEYFKLFETERAKLQALILQDLQRRQKDEEESMLLIVLAAQLT